MEKYFAWVDPEGKKRKLNANASSIPLARFPEAAPISELANTASRLPPASASPFPVSAAVAVVPVPAVTKKGGHMKKKLRGFQKGNTANLGGNAAKSRAKTIAKRKAAQAQVLPDANQPASAKRASIAPKKFVSEDSRRSWTNDPKAAAVGVRKIQDYVQLVKTEEALAYKNKLKLAQDGRTEVFGSLDMLMFQKSAEERVGKLLPGALEQLPSHKGMAEYCKPVLDVVVDFCVRAFAQYEKTIHELEKKVRRLRRENAKLKLGETAAPLTRDEVIPSNVQDSPYARTTLWRHAKGVTEVLFLFSFLAPALGRLLSRLTPFFVCQAIRSRSGPCDVKAMTLAFEVLKMMGVKSNSQGMEQRVNNAIADSVRGFYYELKVRHSGRYPAPVRDAWRTMNVVLGSCVDIPLTAVAESVGVRVDHLYKGKASWKNFLEGDEKWLDAVEKELHKNAWPEEWTKFVQEMWLDESVTRKGEGGGDYCRDPKRKRGTEGGFFPIHWLETPLHVVQEKIQAAAEARFNTVAYSGANTLYSDKRPRPHFPVRPKKERLKRGGGIGKMVQKLRPFQVKRKVRDVCLCHWHLEWELLCRGLQNWRVQNRHKGRQDQPALCPCDCPLYSTGHDMRKALLCVRETTKSNKSAKPVLGVDFEAGPCMLGTCEDCGDLKKLPLCDAELEVLRHVVYMSKENVEYVKNNGDVGSRPPAPISFPPSFFFDLAFHSSETGGPLIFFYQTTLCF